MRQGTHIKQVSMLHDEQYPAFERVVIKPFVPFGLDHVDASIETVKGTIVSSWKNSDKKFQLDIEIPVGCTAKVVLPNAELEKVFEDHVPVEQSKDVEYLDSVSGCQHFLVPSGRYSFLVKYD